MGTYSQKLSEAGVSFTKEPTMSNGFYATTFRFPSMKDVRKAEEATGIAVQGKRGNYHFTLMVSE